MENPPKVELEHSILWKTKIYTVGSIEYEDGRAWREFVTEELNKLEIHVFSPYNKPFLHSFAEDDYSRKLLIQDRGKGDLNSVSTFMSKVRNEDLRLCDLSDFIIAYINPKVASWGAAEEIFWSNRMKKPIFLAVEGGRNCCPLWLLGTIPTKYIYDSVEQIIETIKKINSGEIKIDSDRWHLLQEKYR